MSEDERATLWFLVLDFANAHRERVEAKRKLPFGESSDEADKKASDAFERIIQEVEGMINVVKS